VSDSLHADLAKMYGVPVLLAAISPREWGHTYTLDNVKYVGVTP